MDSVNSQIFSKQKKAKKAIEPPAFYFENLLKASEEEMKT